MIGVCYIDQGMGEQAADWYRKALETPDLDTEAELALRYDLASSLELAGDVGQASGIFEEILSTDPSYRDVSERLNTLAQQRQVN